MTFLSHIVALPVRAYRLIFSPWVGFNCRYQPTCSAYALEALEKHGAVKGSLRPLIGSAVATLGAATDTIRYLTTSITTLRPDPSSDLTGKCRA